MSSLLGLFPAEDRTFWKAVAEKQDRISEIRIRVNRPILVRTLGKEYFLDRQGQLTQWEENGVSADSELLRKIVEHNCRYSMYAYENQIRQGFITIKGGHRIGIAGETVCMENGDIRTIRNFTSLNIRIAHQMQGVGSSVLRELYADKELGNVLIIAPPGCGKTTMLRDLIRLLSDGTKYDCGRTVGVADERGELAGSFEGIPQNNLGKRTDIVTECSKEKAVLMLIRSMAPEILAVDEIGGKDELNALYKAMQCGCKLLATIHGRDEEEAGRRFRAEGFELSEFFKICLSMRKTEDGNFIWNCRRIEK